MKFALVLIGIIIVGVIVFVVSNKLLIKYFRKLDTIFPISAHGVTAFELIVFFIKQLNLNIKVAEYGNGLQNFYSTKKRVIVLSGDVFNNRSLGALTIAMHELGHALQHKDKSIKFYLYYYLSYVNKFLSALSIPLIIFVIINLFVETQFLTLSIILLIVAYVVNLLIRLIIIPVESSASKIAVKLLQDYEILDKKELKMAKKLLRYALLTYIGGFFKIYFAIFSNIMRGF